MEKKASKSIKDQEKNLDKNYVSSKIESLRKLEKKERAATKEEFNARIDMLLEVAAAGGFCPGPNDLALTLGMDIQELSRVLEEWRERLTTVKNLCCAFWEQVWYDGKITYSTYTSIIGEWEKVTNFVRVNRPIYSPDELLALGVNGEPPIEPDF